MKKQARFFHNYFETFLLFFRKTDIQYHMKNILLILLLMLSVFITNAQQTQGITLDEDPVTTTDTLGFNMDSLQTYHKNLICGAYVLGEGEWFSKDQILLTEKLEYIKEGHNAFEYFFFNRNGKIEEGMQINDTKIRFIKDVTISYGAWFIDKDKLNIVLNGFSIKYGKFEYRISYSYKKIGKNIELTVFERKVIAEDTQIH